MMGAAEKADEPIVKPPKPFSLMAKMADGSYLPVVQAPELVALFPRRDRSELDELKTSLIIHGQEGKCLYCLFDDGKSLLSIDGNDTSRAVSELQTAGRPIEVAWELYTPKATNRDELLVELMAIVIRRKFLATAVKKLTPESKKDAIIRYLVAFQSLGGLPPSSLWVAEECGCSHDWVTKVRNEAMDKHILPRATKYRSRSGVERKSDSTRDEALLKTNVIKFTPSATAIKTEAEMESEAAEYERRREERGAAAAETVKKTEDLVDKIIADPGSVIGPALPSPVDDNAPLPDPSSEADVRGGDDDSGERTDVDEELEAVYEWKASLHTPDDFDDNEIRWMFYAGFFNVETLGEQTTVSLVDKDQFLKLVTSKLAPLVKYYGGDPITLESAIAGVLNSSKPATKSKSKPKS
jgi:hypothetical protein